jgi:hypothetical protein
MGTARPNPNPAKRLSAIKKKSLIDDLKWLATSGAEDCTHCQSPPPKVCVAVCTRGQTRHQNNQNMSVAVCTRSQTRHIFKPYPCVGIDVAKVAHKVQTPTGAHHSRPTKLIHRP